MLIVFSGLPGTGKTTLAQSLASRLGATYLRVDSIEQAIRNATASAQDIGRSGYFVACALAADNLQQGRTVIVDCVNPVAESREAWVQVAARTGVQLLNIEVICSDPQVHRQRVENRRSDIPGLTSPTWQSVLDHEYEAWEMTRLTVDSAVLSTEQAVMIIQCEARRRMTVD